MAAAITEEQSRKRVKHSQSIDRISDLPDSVICHILSFLRTKFSVRTSILCRRWMHLWAYVPNLLFHTENQEIDYQLQTWVTFAVVRNVQKLYLCFLSKEDVRGFLPRCLFTCKTLVAMRLRSCGVIPVRRAAVCLPLLKKLHLIYVRFEADESLTHLISGCPVLRELSIKLSHAMAYCNVSSPTIKRLMLDFKSDGTRLEINTPAVKYLKISDSFSEHIKCGVLNSLTKADINLINDENKPDYFLYSRSLLELIDRFRNVKCLKLVLSYCPKIIDSVVYAWTTSFPKLTRLQLTADIRFISMFLKNTENLEFLVLSEFCEEIQGWMEPLQKVPTCLLSHLKIINVVNIKGKKHELEIIKYLLRNAKVLERMEISYPGSLGSNEENNMLKKISLFQRGSGACKVAFVAA
ncbi:PREDICTED: putative FBD-associated F-box protein At5g56440 [Erythranthe guttata]|uniref:putative FBD-associated F-box protein At5g56440 n=1 Tax=Erythranthe guttata TaxID=4155 RepID=UPI00064DF42D|nr:PREDICTED: putative FBD-associated F-box protein At5g56440 [Erythranthe guttata]|eukprot:XP_012842067.1 PREDICTED: putative FBD-associated F-box protein At5g56440 [Erythranthe guttata]